MESSITINTFKDDFKYFKKKCPPPDFSKVLDFSKGVGGTSVKILKAGGAGPLTASVCSPEEAIIAGLMKPPSEWNIYELVDKPGLLFINDPFTNAGQRYWICRCLRDYTQQPNKLNIHAHNVLDKSQDWWNACQSENEHSKSLQRKLRWATLGYHHNWETKVYSDDMKDPFPSDLAVLSRYVSRTVGLQDDFSAEAAIVNFYHFDSTLSGHTDHSEMDMTAPLFSFSFGQTAIFMLGGTSLDVAPTAMYIKSGDIVIMSGHSRKCYHGIPKIVPAEECPWDAGEVSLCDREKLAESQNERSVDSLDGHPCKRARVDENPAEKSDSKLTKSTLLKDDIVSNLLNDEFWKPFKMYIARSRINMNVRQVLTKGERTLNNKDL